MLQRLNSRLFRTSLLPSAAQIARGGKKNQSTEERLPGEGSVALCSADLRKRLL